MPISNGTNDTGSWILDTHVWIRIVNGDPKLDRPRFLRDLQSRADRHALAIASISLWETAMLTMKGRLALEIPVHEWMEEAQHMPGLSVVPLSGAIAVDSSFLPGQFHGDPAGRIIVATARNLNGSVVTLDQAIHEYAEGGYVASVDPLRM